MLKKRNIYLAASGSVFVVILIASWLTKSSGEDQNIVVPVKKGKFEVIVVATGELEAKNSLKIMAPSALQSVRAFRVKIVDMVPEGTKVQKGDYIATLDKADLSEKLHSAEIEITKLVNQLNQYRLDTSINLSTERNALADLSIEIKQKEQQIAGLAYESKATIQTARFELEKLKREYQQIKENYILKKKQAQAKILEISSILSEEKRKFGEVNSLMETFRVMAPQDGMVIYAKEWNGQKKTVGSYIDSFDPVVATLPDMSTMVSKTYVNELDIYKVKVGQPVRVSVDALPHRVIKGQVVSISTIGEQKIESDIKVFEVKVEIQEKDEAFKPTMTTSNAIVCNSFNNVSYIPIECLHYQDDTLQYVFVNNSGKVLRQEVRTGPHNGSEIIILDGLEFEQNVYLSAPEPGWESLPLQYLKQRTDNSAQRF